MLSRRPQRGQDPRAPAVTTPYTTSLYPLLAQDSQNIGVKKNHNLLLVLIISVRILLFFLRPVTCNYGFLRFRMFAVGQLVVRVIIFSEDTRRTCFSQEQHKTHTSRNKGEIFNRMTCRRNPDSRECKI